jgi:preprotein translocase subunit SecG
VNIMMTLLLVVQVLSALGIIVLVLLQHGKGADMGAAFGSGSSGSLFGATGSANFLSRTTAGLAAVFFLVTLALAYAATNRPRGDAGLQNLPQQSAPAAPAGSANAPVAPAQQVPGGTTAPAVPAPAAEPGKPGEIPK